MFTRWVIALSLLGIGCSASPGSSSGGIVGHWRGTLIRNAGQVTSVEDLLINADGSFGGGGVETHSAMEAGMAGCVLTGTITSGTWSITGGDGGMGLLVTVTSGQDVTTNCANSAGNMTTSWTNAMGSEPYTLAGDTLMLTEGDGVRTLMRVP